MPFSQVVHKTFRPAGWDNDAICSYLADAFGNFPANARLRHSLPAKMAEIQARKIETELTGKKFKFQREVNYALLDLLCEGKIATTIINRAKRVSAIPVTIDDVKRTQEILVMLPAAVAQQAIRALCNGWCTSHRLQEAVTLPALCGCVGAIDLLDHYASCPVIWSIISAIDGNPAPTSPLDALGFKNSTANSLIRCTVLANSYHHMKCCYAGRVSDLLDGGNQAAIPENWKEVTQQIYQNLSVRPEQICRVQLSATRSTRSIVRHQLM